MRMLWVALLVLALPTLGHAADSPERLIEQLGSPRFAERERASDALRQQGPGIIPLLRKSLTHRDTEVRRRVGALLDDLIPLAEGREVLLSHKVKLSYKDTPLAVALVDFTRSTGMQIVLGPEEQEKLAQRRVTLKTDEIPAWEALDRFCQAAHLREKPLNVPVEASPAPIVPTEGRARRRRVIWLNSFESQQTYLMQSQIVLLDGKPSKTPTTYAGGLRVQAITPDGPLPSSGAGQTALTLTFATDGRARWQQVLFVRIDQATDVLGQSLRPDRAFVPEQQIPTSDAEEVLLLMDDRNDWPLRPHQVRHAIVRLNLPHRKASALRELRGVVGAEVETPLETLAEVELNDRTLNRQSEGKDGTTVKVTRAELGVDNLLRLGVEVVRPAVPPPAMLVGGNVRILRGGRRGGIQPITQEVSAEEVRERGLTVTDARGRELTFDSGETQSKGVYLLQYRVEKDQAGPFKLVVRGRRLTYVEVPFTLADVPLP